MTQNDGSNKIYKKIFLKIKRKRCKVQGAIAKCTCMTGVNCCVIGNVLNGI